MKLNYLVDTLSFSLTTTPTPIAIPKQYMGATTLLMAAQSDNTTIPWRRSVSETGASKLCPDEDIYLSLTIPEDRTIFYAQTLSGTGELEIELWR